MDTIKIVLIPRPLKPLSVFTYFLLKYFSASKYSFGECIHAKWTEAGENAAPLISSSGITINLAAPDKVLQEFVGSIIEDIPPNYFLRRLMTSVYFPKKHTFDAWLQEQSSVLHPRIILDHVGRVWSEMVRDCVDAWTHEISFPELCIPREHIDLPPGIVLKTLPVVKRSDDITQSRVAVDYSIKRLHENRVAELLGRQIGICVGGPANTGKSTLAAALYIELNNILVSLASRGGGWQRLDELRMTLTTLDAATPVADSIIAHHGQDRDHLRQIKVPWSTELALETSRNMGVELETSNIVLGDLPGKIDYLTEILVAHARYGIIAWKHRSELAEWRNFFHEKGIRIIGEVKGVTDKTSLVTTYRPGETISGRIHCLNRVAGCWDTFVATYASFLLYDILPSCTSRYDRKV